MGGSELVMRVITKLIQPVEALLIFMASLALFVLMLLMFSDVVLRSVLNTPIEAATELTRLLMAIVVFAVLPVVSTTNGQIAVDLLDRVFDRFRLARIRDVVLSLVCGLALIEPARRIWLLAERSSEYGETTEYLNIPTYYLGVFIFISVAVTSVALIFRAAALVISNPASKRLSS